MIGSVLSSSPTARRGFARAMRDAVVGVERVSVALGELVQFGRGLGARGNRLVFVWVPGHCGLVKYEWADVAAQ